MSCLECSIWWWWWWWCWCHAWFPWSRSYAPAEGATGREEWVVIKVFYAMKFDLFFAAGVETTDQPPNPVLSKGYTAQWTKQVRWLSVTAGRELLYHERVIPSVKSAKFLPQPAGTPPGVWVTVCSKSQRWVSFKWTEKSNNRNKVFRPRWPLSSTPFPVVKQNLQPVALEEKFIMIIICRSD